MTDMKLPYVTWRDGRPRFNPSARERAAGFAGRDLRHKDGRWFDLAEAKAWSQRVLAEIEQVRASGAPRPKQTGTNAAGGDTVADLLRDFFAAIEADAGQPGGRSPDTVRTYRAAAAALLYKPRPKAERYRNHVKRFAGGTQANPTDGRELEEFGQESVATIDKIRLFEMYRYLKATRGAAMARGAITVFSSAYSWGGLDRRWSLGRNPRLEFDMEQGSSRIVVYGDAELRAFIAVCDEIGRASIGDSIMLGVYTAQRQRDRLCLADGGLVDGRRRFLQSKTGRLVGVLETPELARRLEQARLRRAELALKFGTRPDTILVDEATGREWNQANYRKVFGEVRKAAAKSCPSLADKRDQDLRDTAVTWLARAGSSLLEICMVSGHSPNSVQTIMRHYLGHSPELGDVAINKLVAWMAREGMRLTG